MGRAGFNPSPERTFTLPAGDIKVRRLGPDDAPEMLRVIGAAWDDTYVNVVPSRMSKADRVQSVNYTSPDMAEQRAGRIADNHDRLDRGDAGAALYLGAFATAGDRPAMVGMLKVRSFITHDVPGYNLRWRAIALRGHTGFVDEIDVLLEHRRQGVGAALSEVGLQHLQDTGRQRLALYVVTGNQPAINFYRDRLGMTLYPNVISRGEGFENLPLMQRRLMSGRLATALATLRKRNPELPPV